MMKMKCLILFIAVCLLFSACEASVTIEGTWYSVTDTVMYNFSNGEITVSGAIVGQYEDNGDSVVISLMNNSTNFKLYVTKMDGIDVLADVAEGDGNIYFCKGLENAQIFHKNVLIDEFKAHLNNTLIGVWQIWDSNNQDNLDYIAFLSDELIKCAQADGSIIDCPIIETNYDIKENRPYVEFLVNWNREDKPTSFVFMPTSDDYWGSEELFMGDSRILHKVE